MPLTKESLIKTFAEARTQRSPFVFVAIEAEGIKEIITVPEVSFDAKEQFYKNAYSNELVHVMNSKVRIVGLRHGFVSLLLDLV